MNKNEHPSLGIAKNPDGTVQLSVCWVAPSQLVRVEADADLRRVRHTYDVELSCAAHDMGGVFGAGFYIYVTALKAEQAGTAKGYVLALVDRMEDEAAAKRRA